MRLRLAGLLAFALFSAAVAAGAPGSRHAVHPAAAERLAVREPEPAPPPPCPVPERLRGAFAAASRETAIPTALLVAMAQLESSMRVDAVSSAGARGLLQLMPPTAAELAVDPDDPAQNLLAGARYLRSMLDLFHSIDLALAAYNAGPTAVAQAGGVPTAQTADYVDAVNTAWRSLGSCE